ncbi:MAG TPA: radical SAM protein, partial [bacterium]|nr:radical SAM protein [bacterium]
MGIRKKLLLIKPYNLSDHIQPCIGLGMLATAVRDAHDVVIIDGIREKLTPEKMAAVVAAHQPDVIGWQLFTFDLQVVRAAAQAVKRCNPAIITIAGGPHPSTMPAETLAYFGAALDYAFAGEAEIALRRFLDGAPLGEVPGLAWRDGDTVRTNERQLVDDLDSLGMPAWDLIKPETYPEAQHGAFFEKFPIAPIMVTRGCPFHCTFCSGYLVSGHKVRVRSAEHVLREIQYLYTERGIREFHIIDDNFTMKRDYVIDFLRKLKALNLDISWATPNGVRMDTLDDEMLTLMKETGLYLISVAAESGSDRILAAMRKSLTVAKTREAVAMIRRHGIDMAGFFIIGFPGETRADVEATIAL